MPSGQRFNISDIIHPPACASAELPFCKRGIYKKWKRLAATSALSGLPTQKQLFLFSRSPLQFFRLILHLCSLKLCSALTLFSPESPSPGPAPAGCWDGRWALVSRQPWHSLGDSERPAPILYVPVSRCEKKWLLLGWVGSGQQGKRKGERLCVRAGFA